MLIGIDASRSLRARRTGTERYSLEIIRHLLALPEASKHHWRLYIDQPPRNVGENAAEWERIVWNSFGIDLSSTSLPGFVEICHLPSKRIWTHRALAQEVITNCPDLLFVPAHVLPFIWPTQRAPATVVTIHDVGYRHFPDAHPVMQRLYLNWSTRWSVWSATRVIAVSQSTAADLHRFYGTPLSKIDVIYEAIVPPNKTTDLTTNDVRNEFRDERHVSGADANYPSQWLQKRFGLTRCYAAYLGSIQPRKNLARLLDAYAFLVAQYDISWDLVLAGGRGWLSEAIYQKRSQLGLDRRVHFTGYISEPDAHELMRSTLFFCLPSLFEGFGLPILEAQSLGVATMTANNSSLPEVAGDAAILVDPTDVDAIAEAMLRLSRDEALRQRLIAAGYKNVKRFSWEKAARETLEVLKKAVGEG